MIDMYIMIWHLKIINLKTILRPSVVGGMPLKRTHVVPSLNIGCTPRVLGTCLGPTSKITVDYDTCHNYQGHASG